MGDPRAPLHLESQQVQLYLEVLSPLHQPPRRLEARNHLCSAHHQQQLPQAQLIHRLSVRQPRRPQFLPLLEPQQLQLQGLGPGQFSEHQQLPLPPLHLEDRGRYLEHPRLQHLAPYLVLQVVQHQLLHLHLGVPALYLGLQQLLPPAYLVAVQVVEVSWVVWVEQPPQTMPTRIHLVEVLPLQLLVEGATLVESLVEEDLVLPHLVHQPPLVAQYLGPQLPAEVEVYSPELDPTLQHRVLGSAPPRNRVHQQDLDRHLRLVLLQLLDRLQPLELLRHLEPLPLQEDQLLELKHRHLEQGLLRHLDQPLELVLLTLLRLLAPWLLGQVEAALVEWLKHLQALVLQQLLLLQRLLNSALGDEQAL